MLFWSLADARKVGRSVIQPYPMAGVKARLVAKLSSSVGAAGCQFGNLGSRMRSATAAANGEVQKEALATGQAQRRSETYIECTFK